MNDIGNDIGLPPVRIDDFSKTPAILINKSLLYTKVGIATLLVYQSLIR